MIGGVLDAVKGCLKEEMRMDIISTNLANATVVGFKKDRISFQEVLGGTQAPNGASQGGRTAAPDPALIRIKAEGEIISINSNSPEIGKIYEEVPIYLEGEGLEIVFNSRYLMDALKVVDVEEIYLQLTGALSPGIITGVDHGDYLYLILPVRTA